jgi:hypothetical protein
MPAYPAYLILAAVGRLLVPGLRARPAPAHSPSPDETQGGDRCCGGGLRRASARRDRGFTAAARSGQAGGDCGRSPSCRSTGCRARMVGRQTGRCGLSWREREARGLASPFYRVSALEPARLSTACAGRLRGMRADDCRLYMDLVPNCDSLGVHTWTAPGPGVTGRIASASPRTGSTTHARRHLRRQPAGVRNAQVARISAHFA